MSGWVGGWVVGWVGGWAGGCAGGWVGGWVRGGFWHFLTGILKETSGFYLRFGG